MAAPTRPGRRGPPGGRGRRLDHAPSARDTPSRRPQNAQTQGHGEKQAARWGQDLDAPPRAEKTDGRARADPRSSADGRPARPVGAHAAPSTAGNRHDGPRAAPRNTFQKFKWIEVTHSVPLDLNRIKNPMGRFLGKPQVLQVPHAPEKRVEKVLALITTKNYTAIDNCITIVKKHIFILENTQRIILR